MIRRARSGPVGRVLIGAALVITSLPASGFGAAPIAPSPSSSATPTAAVGGSAPHTPVTAAPSGPSEAPAPLPKNLEPLDSHDYTGILGKKIMGPDDKELGLVVDVLIDSRGHPRAAIIDFGGFLGVGSRKIAVDWQLLHLTPGQPDWKISLNLGRADIQGAPEYKPDAASNKMVGPPAEASPSSRIDK